MKRSKAVVRAAKKAAHEQGTTTGEVLAKLKADKKPKTSKGPHTRDQNRRGKES